MNETDYNKLGHKIQRQTLCQFLEHLKSIVDRDPTIPIKEMEDYKCIGGYIERKNMSPEIYKPEIKKFCELFLNKHSSTKKPCYLEAATLLYKDFLENN
ncbi:MAG: hypothetical protein J7K26_03035 [Candidatus Aenigmarchaeota archaeon]|nr:hypothetical protein [Candidatus Aenigmarchaeota archaeon]